MMSILKSLFSAVRRAFRSRTDLLLEMTALRHHADSRVMPTWVVLVPRSRVMGVHSNDSDAA